MEMKSLNLMTTGLMMTKMPCINSKSLESSEFSFCLVTLQCSLYYLKQLAVKLQGQNQDVVSGALLIEQTSQEWSSWRTKVDELFPSYF